MKKERTIVSSGISNITKKKSLKSKKTNLEVDKDVESLKKKQKTIKESGTSLKKGDFTQFKNTDDYVTVIANPNELPPTPTILQECEIQNDQLNSSSFVLDFLTLKCFNVDVNTRFSHVEPFDTLKKTYNDKIENQSDFTSDELQSDCVVDYKKKNKLNKNENLNSEVKDFDVSHKNLVIKSHAELYKVSQSKALIFHLQNPCSFSFHGEIKITLISGEVEINGYVLSHSSGNITANLYSPNYCTALVIESKFHNQNKSKEEIKEELSNMLIEEDSNKLLSELKPNDSILLIEQIVSTVGIILNKYIDLQLFPKDLENVSTASKSFKSLQSVFNFTLSKTSRILRKNPQWDRISLGKCTVLCGGKGVGKSTLLRYFVNKLIGNQEKVLCLDFDPGQPEFAVPGCLSATVVDKPLLGPNFTHRFKSEIMVCLGDVNVSRFPARYIEAVKLIVETCNGREDLTEMKCIVNTMGFNKGIGIKLMIDILKILKPDTVIQLKSSDYKRNYSFYLSPSNVNNMKGFKMTENPKLLYELNVIRAHYENKSLIQRGLQPKQLRDIMTLSYFSQSVASPYYNFNAIQPYLISFSGLYLGVDSLVLPNDILKTFNGNMVSLTYFESGCEEIVLLENDDQNYFKIIVKPNVCPSFGLGLVRGIDVSEKKIYLITPLSSEEINKINCLTLGKINPPHSMFIKQETVEGSKAYTSADLEENQQKIKRIFRSPGLQFN